MSVFRTICRLNAVLAVVLLAALWLQPPATQTSGKHIGHSSIAAVATTPDAGDVEASIDLQPGGPPPQHAVLDIERATSLRPASFILPTHGRHPHLLTTRLRR